MPENNWETTECQMHDYDRNQKNHFIINIFMDNSDKYHTSEEKGQTFKS